MHSGHSSGIEFMDGMIDGVKIRDQVLTSDQVQAEMAVTTHTKDS